MEEMKRIAGKLLSVLETKTDIDGISSVAVAASAPRDLVAIINDEICGDDLPYPYSLKMMKKVLEAIERVDDDDDIESIHQEVARIAAPQSTKELTAWLNAGEYHYRYCDYWAASVGRDGSIRLIDLLAGGWTSQMRKIAAGLVAELQAYIANGSAQADLTGNHNER